jgi:hypothetical protein
MEYKTLTQEERDDLIVSFYQSQERDLFLHQINKERYEEILKTAKEGDFRAKIERLLLETESRIANVSQIVQATEKQLPNEVQIKNSLDRIRAKEERER